MTPLRYVDLMVIGLYFHMIASAGQILRELPILW